MKNLRTLALAAVATFASAAAFAGTSANTPADKSGCLATHAVKAFEAKAYMSTNRPGRLNVVVVKSEDMPVHMRLVDAEGNLLYKTIIADNAALLPLNVTQLERGTYTIQLSRCDQTLSQTVAIK